MTLCRSGRLLRLTTAAVVLAACGRSATPPPGQAPPERISHVHGLGVGHGGEVFVATHFGLYVHDGGEWSRRSADRDDHMGFSHTPAGTWRSGHPSGGGSFGVQASTDGGRTWKTLDTILTPPVDFHAMTATRNAPAALYGWDSGGRGVFRSDDGGKSWTRAKADGLPRAVGGFAASATDGVVWASGADGVYRTDDHAETWSKVGDVPLFALAAGGQPEVLWGSKARANGVMRSSDGGTTWADPESGPTSQVVALAVSNDGATLVAADGAAQVWQSTDGGVSWNKIEMP